MQMLMAVYVFRGGMSLKGKNIRSYMILKRVLDIIFGITLSLFLAAPMALIWLAVAMTSRGGGIFSQVRIGKDGKEFICYKFRTMRKDTPVCSAKEMAEQGGADRYLTPIGRFLRRTSLDELPQLWNVVKGDMSLVGPRPLIADEREVHRARERSGVYSVRPGITGLAQVKGRNSLSDERKVELDTQYLNELGFIQDVRILGLTALGVISRKDIDVNS